MFTAAQPCPLMRITEENDSVLRDGSENCRRRWLPPAHRNRFSVEFSNQIRLASVSIDQADIAAPRSLVSEDGFGDFPNRAAKHFSQTQIFQLNPYGRKL